MDVLSIESLFESALKEGISFIKRDDAEWFLENKKQCAPFLLEQIAQEFSKLLEGQEFFDEDRLYEALHFAAFFEEEGAFPWLQKLCRFSSDTIEEWVGGYFVTEDLGYILAATAGSAWKELKEIIEDPTADEFVRQACLDALTIMVASHKIERSQIVSYFQTIFHKVLQQVQDDSSFVTYLVAATTNLWPGDCLEEIRECFGLDLVEIEYIDMQCVLECVEEGEMVCIERLRKQTERAHFLRQFFVSEKEMEFDEDWEGISSSITHAQQKIAVVLQKPGRNDTCFCGSGKKYKKCCLHKESSETQANGVYVEECSITFEPLEDAALMQLPEHVQGSITDLFYMSQEEPEKAIDPLNALIVSYPHIPQLYNHLYMAYSYMGQVQKAKDITRETMEKFPDYLFAKLAYASYLLRRGEPEKIPPLFSGAYTLSQLYPNRDTFHVTEFKDFSYIMAEYFIQMDQIDQAKIYLQMLEKIVPESCEAKNIKQKIQSHAFYH